jgi:hypothetical protein
MYIGATTAIQKPPIQAAQWVNRSEPNEKLKEDLSTITKDERTTVKRIMTNATHRSKSLKRVKTIPVCTLDKLQKL